MKRISCQLNILTQLLPYFHEWRTNWCIVLYNDVLLCQQLIFVWMLIFICYVLSSISQLFSSLQMKNLLFNYQQNRSIVIWHEPSKHLSTWIVFIQQHENWDKNEGNEYLVHLISMKDSSVFKTNELKQGLLHWKIIDQNQRWRSWHWRYEIIRKRLNSNHDANQSNIYFAFLSLKHRPSMDSRRMITSDNKINHFLFSPFWIWIIHVAYKRKELADFDHFHIVHHARTHIHCKYRLFLLRHSSTPDFVGRRWIKRTIVLVKVMLKLFPMQMLLYFFYQDRSDKPHLWTMSMTLSLIQRWPIWFTHHPRPLLCHQRHRLMYQ